MNINLGAQWETFINTNIKTGRYLSASEVVREALRLLQEREQVRQLRMDDLRKEVRKGLDELDRGEGLRLDEQGMKDYLKDVRKRGMKRLSKKQAKSK